MAAARGGVGSLARRPGRGFGFFALSTAVHGGLIAAAVWSTSRPRPLPVPRPKKEVAVVDLVVFSEKRQDRTPEAAKSDPPREQTPRGFQRLVAPTDAPPSIPEVNVTQPALLQQEDFTGRGVAGGLASGIGVAPLPNADGRAGGPIDGGDADEPPYLLPGQMGPAYPNPLRDDRPDGLVVVRFVLDTAGRVEAPSLSVVEATHPLFLAEVRTTLGRLRYLPARLSGRPVRVRMEQRFEFHLASP